MDDLKLFAKNDNGLEGLLQAVNQIKLQLKLPLQEES